MKTNYEIRYAEHPDDVKSYDTKSIRCDFLIGKAFSQNKVSIEYKPVSYTHLTLPTKA